MSTSDKVSEPKDEKDRIYDRIYAVTPPSEAAIAKLISTPPSEDEDVVSFDKEEREWELEQKRAKQEANMSPLDKALHKVTYNSNN